MGAQAEKELGPDWTLQKADAPGVPNPPAWLAKNLPAGAHVGVDPFVHTIHAARNLQQVRLLLQCRSHSAGMPKFVEVPLRQLSRVTMHTCKGCFEMPSWCHTGSLCTHASCPSIYNGLPSFR